MKYSEKIDHVVVQSIGSLLACWHGDCDEVYDEWEDRPETHEDPGIFTGVCLLTQLMLGVGKRDIL